MSKREIIVNASLQEEIRIAILENRKLVDLDIETQGRAKLKGNIYKGVISNVEESLDAVFVDIGEERQTFLPFTEIRPNIVSSDAAGANRKSNLSKSLCAGQELVVQVTKDGIGNKGAAVSTYLSIPGRYVVLMHGDRRGGISRKIASEMARKTARESLSHFQMPTGMAAIIRTAGVSASQEQIIRDFQSLCTTWTRLGESAKLGRAPTLLHREPDLIVRTIRDYYSPDVRRIVIDSKDEYEDALAHFKEHMPDLVNLLEHHQRKEPIFQHYGIEQTIEKLYEREVKLPSGGSIVIEQTEALVSVDVNSGKSTAETDHEATVYKTNLEAIEEIACQLRLRDLGGIIVIDLIDMASLSHKREIERRLSTLARVDKARVKVGRISENGTLELTRQRLRQSHRLISHVSCNYCKGTGRIRDAEGLAFSALRRISGYLARKRVPLAKLTVSLPAAVATVLNNHKRRELVRLCDAHDLDLYVLGGVHLQEEEMEFKEERRGQAGLSAAKQAQAPWRNPSSPSRSKAHYARGKKRAHKPPAGSVPTAMLDLGPAPTLLEIPPQPQLSTQMPRSAFPRHFDDPLEEALFGYTAQE
ncbi:MAG: Rne/Rng family ribonuclease [Myxococcota bacterium]